jgi:DNA-binding CsgD family transcriptional regulator
MTQFPQLSSHEWEVVNLLLQGKSNKLIALSLGISDRTVEFHLKNVYAKFQVNSRVELILILVNATGGFDSAKLGHSTVDCKREVSENRDRFNSRMNWATSFREAVSIISEELEMKTLLSLKYVFAGLITALFTGFIWVLVLLYFHSLSPNEIKAGITPMVVIWEIIGITIGLVGKHNDNTLLKVFSSTLIGTGLSPFAIIPLMFIVVLPVGKFVERLGFIDASTMSKDIATTLAITAMIGLWLIVGITIGSIWLYVTIKKPGQKVVQSPVLEQNL